MVDEPLFTIIPADEAEAIRQRSVSTSKWDAAIAALLEGATIRVPIRQTQVPNGLGELVRRRYPNKRAKTRGDGDTHTFVWLVDR